MGYWQVWSHKKTGERVLRFLTGPSEFSNFDVEDTFIHFDELAPDGGPGEPFAISRKEFYEQYWRRNN